MVRPGTLRLPDCRQLEHEAAARARAGGDVSTAHAGEPAGERQAEAGAAPCFAVAAHAGLEGPLTKLRFEARTIVADRKSYALTRFSQLDPHAAGRVPAG